MFSQWPIFECHFTLEFELVEKLLSSAQTIHDWFSLICSLKNMYEQFTGGQIAIVNECNVKECTLQTFKLKKAKLAKCFF